MSEAYDNLEELYAAFSADAFDGLFSGDVYQFDGVEFVSQYARGSTAERFNIVKSISFIEYFVEFCRSFIGKSVFELGIAAGGSTALLALAAQPRKLVSIDLESQRVAALDEFATRRGLTDKMKFYYSVDQSNTEQLRTIVAEEFGEEGLDLVVDDASHHLEPTRASFEALFPYLKPGGVFTIEDWNADIEFRDALVDSVLNPTTPVQLEHAARLRQAILAQRGQPSPPPKPSLCTLAVELLLACASSASVIAEVTVNKYWIVVRRGVAEVDPTTFRLADLYRDYFGFVPSSS